jgi:hypothetical protein
MSLSKVFLPARAARSRGATGNVFRAAAQAYQAARTG